MFGDESKQFFVAANTNETGYMRLYENKENGWSEDNPVALNHANVQGLSVSNGERTVIDKLSLNGFKIGSIDVYGRMNPNCQIVHRVDMLVLRFYMEILLNLLCIIYH